MKIRSIILFIVVLCLAPAVPRLAAANPLQRSHLVEKNVDIVLRVSNVVDFMNALDNSPYGKLWNSPEMKPFLNNQVLGDALIKSILLSRVKESVMAEALHVNRKILSLLKGELIFAIELGRKGKKEDGEKEKSKFYALAEMTEEDYKEIRELFTQASKTLGEKTVSRRYVFQGVELIQDITAGEKDELIEWTAFCGNTYLNGSSRPWVEQCIVRLQKELPVKIPGPPSIRAWLPDGFFQRLLEAEEEKSKNPGEGTTGNNSAYSTVFMKALAIDKVGTFSLEWVIYPSYSELAMHVQNKGGNRGMWTMMSSEPLPRGLSLHYIPGDVLSYQVLRVNVPAFWQEIPSILETFGPQAAAQFQAWLNMTSQMLQVDIGRDIVANLDTVLTYYSCLEGSEDASLYIWQLRNSMAMEKTLGKLFVEGSWLRNMMKENCEILDFNEHKVYSFKTPRPRPRAVADRADGEAGEKAGGQVPVSPPIDWVPYGAAVVDGDLVFGRLGLLRSYIAGSRDTGARRKFYKSPLFTRLLQRVPDNAIGYGFSDIAQWLEPTVNFFRAWRPSPLFSPPQRPTSPGEEKPGAATGPKPGAFDDFFNKLKFDRLPSPEFLKSFFGPWFTYYQFNGEELAAKWEFHNPGTK